MLGARPRTLAAAAVPVAVGTAAGWWLPGPVHRIIWWRAVCALVVALAVQVGTNYANDYSDGVRGTDEGRVGPLRLVASGLASPTAVRRAALLSFGVAAVAGLALAAATSWWLVAVGAACFVAGWLYTGGPKPYGYLGLGELFVFVFFGLVATVGSAYVQYSAPWPVASLVAAAVPVGPAGHGAARGQQPARHRRRRPGREADPGRAPRAPAEPAGSTSARWSGWRSASAWWPSSGRWPCSPCWPPPSPCRRSRPCVRAPRAPAAAGARRHRPPAAGGGPPADRRDPPVTGSGDGLSPRRPDRAGGTASVRSSQSSRCGR